MTDVPDDVFGNHCTTTGMIPTDDAAPELVISAVLYCCGYWHRDARIIGNIRAGDIDRALHQIMVDKEADAARIAELETAFVGQRRAIEALIQENEVLSGIIATQDLAIKRMKEREGTHADPA